MQRYAEELMAVFWDDDKAIALFKESARILDKAVKNRPLERSLTKTEAFTAEVEKAFK